MAARTLIIFGLGGGTGISTAALFARQGFQRIVLVDENTDGLRKSRRIIEDLPGTLLVELSTWVVDLTRSDNFHASLNDIELWTHGVVDCILYNYTRTDFSISTVLSGADVQLDFHVGPPVSFFLSTMLTLADHQHTTGGCFQLGSSTSTETAYLVDYL
jgi:NAD(P)-dependent dehydrogenase (short-subunit alcohol dehydrogenase family)